MRSPFRNRSRLERNRDRLRMQSGLLGNRPLGPAWCFALDNWLSACVPTSPSLAPLPFRGHWLWGGQDELPADPFAASPRLGGSSPVPASAGFLDRSAQS